MNHLILILWTVAGLMLTTVLPPAPPIPAAFVGTWAIFEIPESQCAGAISQQITIAEDGTTTGSGINTATCAQSESIGWPGRVTWHCFRRDVCSWRWVSAGGLNPIGVASRHSPALIFDATYTHMTMRWSNITTVRGTVTTFEQTYTKQT